MSEIEQYDYDLPPDLIAQQPLARRSDARLMVVHRADRSIAHAHVRDLPEILSAGDAVVVNNTRVAERQELRPGDTVKFGSVEARVCTSEGLWRLMRS